MTGQWAELWLDAKKSLRRTALYMAIYSAVVFGGAFIEIHFFRH